MKQIEHVLTDKGSKYAVSGDEITNRTEAADFIKNLKRKKKFAKATHNTWAVIFADGEQVKNDDGESGAGTLILQMLERENLHNHIVVVTRWYGGVHLGGDRFRHVKTCVQEYLALD
jgi:putative IMPACT (imprinted ancient) family translation regulator